MANDIYTKEEELMLDDILKKSYSMITEAFKDGPPKDYKGISTLSEAMQRTETMIHNKAKLRQEQQKANTDSEIKATIAETIKQAIALKSNLTRKEINEDVTIKDGEITVPEFAPGEAEIEYKPISADEFRIQEVSDDID